MYIIRLVRQVAKSKTKLKNLGPKWRKPYTKTTIITKLIQTHEKICGSQIVAQEPIHELNFLIKENIANEHKTQKEKLTFKSANSAPSHVDKKIAIKKSETNLSS